MSRKKKRKNKKRNKENKRKEKNMHNFGLGYQGYGNLVSGGIQDDGEWTVKIDTIDSCSKAPESILVWFSILAKKKMDALMGKFKSIEWLAYLIGEKINDAEYIIEDLFIPKQKVSSTRVDNIECDNFNDLKTIGVIHSHHGMGNGFSGTDHEFINQNHNVSLCISKDGINGQVRWKTPCGALKIIDNVKTKLKIDFDFDKESFFKEVDKLISTQNTYVYPNNIGRCIPRTIPNAVSKKSGTYVNGVAVTKEAFDLARGSNSNLTIADKQKEIASWQEANQDKINKLWDSDILDDNPSDVLIEEERSLREELEKDFQ